MGTSHDTLPPHGTPFVGRVAELNVLATLLADSSCQLITVLGPGGIGKTRVAIELATRLRSVDLANGPAFADGVWFVALQDIGAPADLISTIADTLRCPLPGVADPHNQLLNWLHPKQLLLVLDTFEHLTAAVDLLSTILAAAPHVKLVVTSREALNIQEEWRYPLSGLELPAADHAGGVDQSSAVRLFVERARRVRHDFDLVTEQDAVVRICQLVEGMPLAIELAAAWTRTLSCAAIAREMTDNLQFLAGAWRNVPARHRSMRAAFDHSWSLLDSDERNVLMRLSVFRGGFGREAAEAIAGATLPILTALVDKSLLRSLPGGHMGTRLEDQYQIHDLLRQYAAEHLEQSPAGAAQVREAHCAYYVDFLHQRAENVNGQRQREALAEIAADFENVRTAWRYAVDHTRIAEIQRAAYTFYLFHDYQSRYHEGADLFERAAQALSGADLTVHLGPVLAELLVCLGWLDIRLGRLQQARTVLERSQAILRRLDVSPRPGPGTDPLTALGTLACTLGEYAEAARLGEEARRLNEARGDQANLMYAYYVLTNAASAQGDYDAARHYAHQAYALADRLRDRWFMAYILSDQGHVASALGDLTDAKRQYQASYAIREEFGDPEGMAVARANLSRDWRPGWPGLRHAWSWHGGLRDRRVRRRGTISARGVPDHRRDEIYHAHACNSGRRC
jgi:predicted ATPase